MTVKEYIDNNLPFYHITPSKNKDNILESGLHRGKSFNAVCVVRGTDDDDDIFYDIAFSLLSGEEDREFIVIKLLPLKHEIKVEDVAPDGVSDLTAPLHNYLYNKTFAVSEEDIVKTIRLNGYKNLSNSKIVTLEGYLRQSPQDYLQVE